LHLSWHYWLFGFAEDTSVPSAYIFFLQLPRLRILGAGAEGVYLVYKLALNLIQKRI
jgi:hypothetical protein